jgi:hypothetical protein
MNNNIIESKKENNLSTFYDNNSIYMISKKNSQAIENHLNIDDLSLIENNIKHSIPLYYVILHSIVLGVLSVAILFLQSKIMIHEDVNNFYIGVW